MSALLPSSTHYSPPDAPRDPSLPSVVSPQPQPLGPSPSPLPDPSLPASSSDHPDYPDHESSSSSSSSSSGEKPVVAALHAASLSADLNTLVSTLEQYKSHLSCIPLAPPQQCDASQAVKDIMRERVVLNGVRFLGQGSLFLETLRRLASVLCSDKTVNGSAGDSQGNFVVDSILTRCARTTSGFDSYNTVLQLLPSPDMLLKPRPGLNPPIDIELFISNGSVHGAVSSTNMYGFYRFEDIEVMGNRMSYGDRQSGDTNSKDRTDEDLAWLSIDTVVVEKIDFRTGRSLRFLRVEVPERMGSENRSTLFGDQSV
ncbi:hypothetical protein TrRE_jg1002 [Triparma retinervis]|uniref:Uncharacterized protein n=1 Tax=Triparma retinervis TaxID=2557542 RepID=A0A9W7E5W9_9STRA|nr:hypothetical protein TrRE_jg1002 [Triparma retinervis]